MRDREEGWRRRFGLPMKKMTRARFHNAAAIGARDLPSVAMRGRGVLQELGTPPLSNPVTAVAAVAALTAVGLVWGFVKGRNTRAALEQRVGKPMGKVPLHAGFLLGTALEEEVVYRAGVNTIAGPYIGSALFGLGHFNAARARKMPTKEGFRALDAGVGGLLYSLTYAVGAGPLDIAEPGFATLGAMMRGVACSTMAHAAHNTGVRLGLSR